MADQTNQKPAEPATKSLQCPDCDAQFKVPYELKKHTNEQHLTTQIFLCPFPDCDAYALRREGIEYRHLKRYHSISLPATGKGPRSKAFQATIDQCLKDKGCSPIKEVSESDGVTYGNLVKGLSITVTSNDTAATAADAKADQPVDDQTESVLPSHDKPAQSYEDMYGPIEGTITEEEKGWMMELDGTGMDSDSEDGEDGKLLPSI